MSIRTARLTIFIGVLILASAHASLARGSNACQEMIEHNHSLEEVPRSVSPQRLKQIVAHQNHLRAQAHLPLLTETSMPGDATHFSLELKDGFPDYEVAGIFTIVDDKTILRSVQNDLFSLNHVYEFSGDRLLRSVPYGQWLIEKMPAREVSLYRQMSPIELSSWQNSSYDKLGSEWGYSSSVVHFTTNKDFTSAPRRPGDAIIEIRIEQSVLLRLASRQKIWAASLDAETVSSEIVWPAKLLAKAIKAGVVRVHLAPRGDFLLSPFR